jgi:hypothetical protein
MTPTLGNGYYGLELYGRPTYYLGPAAPEVPQFVIPAEALNPQTPLMSLAASGEFVKQKVFYLKRVVNPQGYDSVKPRQIVANYARSPDTKTPCKLFLRQSFKEAVASWMALGAADRQPFIELVNHYGLVMNPRNLFISKFMKAKIASPENPCTGIPRRDTRRLRRSPGRT